MLLLLCMIISMYVTVIYGKCLEPRHEKTKAQISCALTAKLISAFVFNTQIVQSVYFLNPKFQASSYLLLLHSLVFVSDLVRNLKTCFLMTQLLSFIVTKET